MVVKNAGIQFHRRSRYEDILELVNDNEDALKPFPNRDAVFYKQSNKGTRFDGKDHLDKLKIQEKQIAEAIARDLMKRQYAEDNDTTYKAFTQHDRPEPEQPRTPEQFHIGTDPDDMSYIEEYGTPQEQQLAQINETLGNIATAQQSNQQAIYEAHQQQLEREEEGGSGILRSLGSGALRVGRGALSVGSGALRVGSNVAGNMISGMDFGSSLATGLSQEVAQLAMNRLLPQPRPLLDFSGTARDGQYTTYDPTPIPNTQYLEPSIVLQPHQPNIGATQQPLPIASSSQPTQAELPPIPKATPPATPPQRPAEPKAKPSPKPAPQPNFQQGGASSSSSGNAPPPQQEENQEIKNLMRQVDEQNIFPVWGAEHGGLTDKQIAKTLAKLNLNDYSSIDPQKINFNTVVELFRIAKLRNNLSQTDEDKLKRIFTEINTSRNVTTDNVRDVKTLFSEIFKDRTPQQPENVSPRRLTRKTNMKEGTVEEQDMDEPTLIKPSKIGIQKLREVFEEANNRNTINTRTYRSYRKIYNNWIKSAGDKEMKKGYLKELKNLYRDEIFRK